MKENHRIECHPGPIRALLTAGSLAFLCVISLLLMQAIHPAPTKLTLQSDAAELLRLEAQLRVGDSHTDNTKSTVVCGVQRRNGAG